MGLQRVCQVEARDERVRLAAAVCALAWRHGGGCPKRMVVTPRKRRLGTTDLEITTVGFGAWAIGGGGWAYGWGPQDDARSIAAIRHAVSRGERNLRPDSVRREVEASLQRLGASSRRGEPARAWRAHRASAPLPYQWRKRH